MACQIPPPSMDWQSTNLPKVFDRFARQARLHFNGPLKDMAEDVKISYLLLWSGVEGQDISDTFEFGDGEGVCVEEYMEKFHTYIEPRSSFRVSRHNLLQCRQQQDESAHAFVKRLRQIIKLCDYDPIVETTLLVDLFIFGLNMRTTQKSLLKEGKNLTITEALQIAETEEATSKQVEAIRLKHGALQITEEQASNAHAVKSDTRAAKSEYYNNCMFCKKGHYRGECPARGKTCDKCNGVGHFAIACRSRNRRKFTQPQYGHPQSRKKNHRNAHDITTALSDQEDDNEPDEAYFHAISRAENKESTIPADATEAYAHLRVGNKTSQININAKVDTGAMSNLIPWETFKKLQNIPLKDTPIRLYAFGGTQIEQAGTCRLGIRHGQKFACAIFHVVKSKGPTLLGLQTSRKLGLVTLNFTIGTNPPLDTAGPEHMSPRTATPAGLEGDTAERERILQEFPDVFDGIGCLPGEYSIKVDPTVPPVVHPPRRVPVALRDKFKAELNSLVEQDIITPVTKPTSWVNSFVCVTKKNGSVRLCLDPKDLNNAVLRPHFVTPTFEEVASRLHGAKWFTIVDVKSGYWNMKLDKKSRELTTFITPEGRYMFKRFPMGVKSAQDEFQRAMYVNFGDIENVLSISDDTIVVGFTEDGSDHDKALNELLQRARSKNCKFNPEKFVVRAQEISFFGHIISKDGVKPDPKKIEAIVQMNPPKDEKQLASFLGLANYLNKFSPQLATLTKPLRDLLSTKTEFKWSAQEQAAFEKIKEEIGQSIVLRYFDPKAPIKIQVDASAAGLGAALLQNDMPVALASKTLTGPETRYSNIEREMLAVVFGLEKFHHYVWGHAVTIQTDHKPLESIALKNLAQAPPRLARMLLKIQGYDFTIKYSPGAAVPIADCMSRVSPTPGGPIKDVDINIHLLNAHLNASPIRLQDIRKETEKDPVLTELTSSVMTGWPAERSTCHPHVQPFWNYRDEIGLQDGVLLKGRKIIIPTTLQSGILKQLHSSHQGIEKTRLLARTAVFWVGINRSIEQIVGNCSTCQKYQPSIPSETLLQHESPSYPWQYISTDLFSLEDKEYLLLVDHYSRSPFIRRLHSTTSAAVIRQMKSIFEDRGVPETVYSDNGPQYTSEEFASFANIFNFKHTTSSPHHAKSNGFAERMVGICKKLIMKAQETGTDYHLAMMAYRATPLSAHLKSPAELLNGRPIRTPLISVQQPGDEISRAAMQQRKERTKDWYDRKNNRQHSQLYTGQQVHVQDRKTKLWEPGMIVQNTSEPRSYLVKQTDGSIHRRNRQLLRPAKENGVRTCSDTNICPHPHTKSAGVPTKKNKPQIPGTPASNKGLANPRRSSRTTKPPQRLDL